MLKERGITSNKEERMEEGKEKRVEGGSKKGDKKEGGRKYLGGERIVMCNIKLLLIK